MLRFYGDQSRSSDTSFQCEIFKLLSLKGLGPKLYGKFDDGRLEEYLPSDSMSCSQLWTREISSVIAKKLAIVHSLNVPVNKEDSWLLDRLNLWSEQAIKNSEVSLNADSQGLSQSTKDIARRLMKINFREEINFIRKVFQHSKSPKVFSHNDLHQGNILFAEPTKRRPTLEERIVFIDFEYCSYNYRAYDIANHFCEWLFEYGSSEYPHFKYFQDKFPTLDEQKNFVHHYLKQINRMRRGSSTSLPLSNSFNNNGCEESHSNRNGTNHIRYQMNGISNGNLALARRDEDALIDEIEPFFMAVSLHWALWCIKQAQTSTIKFGYWEHAMVRWNLYSNFKAKHLEGNKIATFMLNGHI